MKERGIVEKKSGAKISAALTTRRTPLIRSTLPKQYSLINSHCQERVAMVADFERENHDQCAPPGTRTQISLVVSKVLCPIKLAGLTHSYTLVMLKKFLNLVSSVALLLLAALSPVYAFKPWAHSQADVQRFGLNKIYQSTVTSLGEATPAIYSYNHAHFPNHAVGLKSLSVVPAFSLRPSQVGASFLQEEGKAIGLDATQLQLEKENSDPGHMHALYQQVYQGIPVEFSHVKIHMDSTGAIVRLNSNFLPNLNLNTNPAIPSQQVASVVTQDSGGFPVSPTLVIFPDLTTQAPHLAWRFLVRLPQALWRYYVDAQTGQILFRYNIFESAFTGNVSGLVYDIDPNQQACTGSAFPPCPIQRNFPNEWIYAGGASNPAATDNNGNYTSNADGEMFTMLQGQYINVASYFGANASYTNEGGSWATVSENASFNSQPSISGGIVSSVTISIPIPLNAVAFLPVFSTLNVGQNFSASGENFGITVDDELLILNSNGVNVGSYVGNLTPNSGTSFNGTIVPGQSLSLLMALQPNSPGGDSYVVSQSSYLVLSNPFVTGSNNNLVWASTMTPTGLEGELSLYYHLNLQHEFFSQVLGSMSSTFLSGTASALAFFGPNMFNAFYDPQDNNLWFGDGGVVPLSQAPAGTPPTDVMTDDATVPQHELTHYLVQKIWPITNFGQSGSVSEGNADFWSANSLNDPAIGLYVGGGTPARYLCGASSDTLNGCAITHSWSADGCGYSGNAIYSSATWQGEIHCDGEFMSQSLWELRGKEIANDGCNNSTGDLSPAPQGNAQLGCGGIACISGLEMNALLFFPESFTEMEQALLDVNSMGIVSACRFTSPSQIASDITTSFSDHGISLCSSPEINANDPYCNTGFETAIDVSTIPSITATLYPAGEQDFYTFAAGPGAITVTLNLPPSNTYPGYYKAYEMTLLDQNHNIITTAQPPYNGVNTTSGYCDAPVNGSTGSGANDCETAASSVQLTYSSSGGRFFVEVTGGNDGADSVSGVSSLTPYTLSFDFPTTSAFSASVVSAMVNQDLISFQVGIASNTYLQTPQYSFAYAQLRDQNKNVLENTQTYPSSPTNYLSFVSSDNVNGQISGSVQIQNNFSSRFPAVGTVYLEVFGYDVAGSTVSMGLSEPLSLGASGTDASAWNNIFNPNKGQEATIKYDVQSSGHLTIKIYTMNGLEVATLFDGPVSPGSGSISWAGHNLRNYTVASGIYLVRVQGPGLSKTLKVAVVK